MREEGRNGLEELREAKTASQGSVTAWLILARRKVGCGIKATEKERPDRLGLVEKRKMS